MATLSSVLAWKIPMDRGAWWAIVHGATVSRDRVTKHSTAQPKRGLSLSGEGIFLDKIISFGAKTHGTGREG